MCEIRGSAWRVRSNDVIDEGVRGEFGGEVARRMSGLSRMRKVLRSGEREERAERSVDLRCVRSGDLRVKVCGVFGVRDVVVVPSVTVAAGAGGGPLAGILPPING